MNIVEDIADDPYAAQVTIHELPEVASVTQLGVRLRVLIPESFDAPLALIEKALRAQQIDARVQLTDATLEDVFVAVTLKQPPGDS
jgi:ABC-2 type transport system ATP-binding protein